MSLWLHGWGSVWPFSSLSPHICLSMHHMCLMAARCYKSQKGFATYCWGQSVLHQKVNFALIPACMQRPHQFGLQQMAIIRQGDKY